MAKKKVTPPPSAAVVTEFQNTDNLHPRHRPDSPTDDRMENLKTLNGLLVKETMDSRVQLGQLKSQIGDMSLESSILSDIDRAVCRLVVEAALKEAQQKFVAKTEECKLEAWEEIRRVKVEVESLMREKEENARCFVEVNQEVARLKREKDDVERDLVVVVGEKDERGRECDVLRSEVNLLKEKVLHLDDAINRSNIELEEKKRESDSKIDLLVMENKSVIESLNKELIIVTREKDKLEILAVQLSEKLQCSEESCQVFGDEKKKLLSDVRELKDEIVGSHKESNNLRKEIENLKSRVLELEEGIERSEAQLKVEKRENERKMELFIMENNLVISNLKEELSHLVCEKVELEKTRAEQSEKLQSFEESCGLLGEEKKHLLATVNELKDEIDLLKREETAKLLTISELQKMNDKYIEKISKLHRELDAKTEEGVEREMVFTLRMEEMSGQMDGLQRILEAVVEEKERFKLMNCKQESEIDNLAKEVELLKPEVSCLSKSRNDQAEDIKRLEDENAYLQKVANQQIVKEKDLELQVVALQNSKATADKELEHLKTATDKVAEEKKMLENKLQCLIEEKEAACSVLASTKQDFEDHKKETRATAELSELALAALKGTAEELSLGEHKTSASGLGEDNAKSELLADERIKLFLVELESIKKFFWIRKKEMEMMKHELLLLQESIAGAKKRGLWAWVSSATTIVAAVAYAVKSR